MTILFPIIYSAALTYLVWKAFKVMSNGWGISDNKNKRLSTSILKQKKYTIHPEVIINHLINSSRLYISCKSNIPTIKQTKN